MHLKDSQQAKLAWFRKFLKNCKLSNNKFINMGLLLLVGILIVAGSIAASNLIQQGLKVAKAEDVTAFAPVAGNYRGNLILSPDGSTIYIGTSGYSNFFPGAPVPGITRYDAATNNMISSIALENSEIIMNPSGTKIYAFTG